ncbi:MAG: UbiA prenyltransferase family protein [Desulfobulbales bacterium]
MNKELFRVKTYWELARPADYGKNFFVLAPLFFAGDLFGVGKCMSAALAVLVFCLLASGSYAINDILDARQDRLHPAKQGRPVASGRIDPGCALAAACIWIGAGTAISAAISQAFLLACVAYLVLQLLYSLILKHWPVCDVLAISAGFIVRLIAGGIAVQVYVPSWLILCTGLLALFLAIGKRRCELTVLQHPVMHRRIFQYYSPGVLDRSLIVTGLSTLSSYVAYICFSGTGANSPKIRLIFTIPLVAAWLYRFYAIFRHDCHYRGIMEIILQDTPIKTILALWGCMYFAVLYF